MTDHARLPKGDRRKLPDLAAAPPSANSHAALVDRIDNDSLDYVDSREWVEEWAVRWVVYADLIAFAGRAEKSRDVVLNNIVRFDRASNLARDAHPGVTVHRFSDSTYAVANSIVEAIAFGVSLHHACLAMNVAHMRNDSRHLFVHTIVPRITVAKGHVLAVPSVTPRPKKHVGLRTENLLAGDAFVKAYRLERHSAGGLLTVARDECGPLASGLGGSPTHTESMKQWATRLSEPPVKALFVRGKHVDLPWLLFRPFGGSSKPLQCASRSEAAPAIAAALDIWDLSAREYYSPGAASDPLDTAKHAQASIRHVVQCVQALNGHPSIRYFTTDQARQLLATSNYKPAR
jgi:hypothetical protein